MLNINPAEWFVNLPPEVAVFLLSMIPITELRASIPIGIEIYNLPIWKVWLLSVIGGLIPATFILLLIPLVHDYVIKHRFFGPVLTKFLKRAERNFKGKHAKYGSIALVLFVGTPLPLTGSWTGSLAAFVFNIPFKKAFPLILSGVVLAATIVTFLTVFAGSVWRWFI